MEQLLTPILLLEALLERHTVYAFYPFAEELAVSKLPDHDKYFLNADGCSCPGCRSHGDCKHLNMIRGIWTPADGTRDWFEGEFDGILTCELPDAFSTAIVKTALPFEYQMLCLTVEYKRFKMGVQIVDLDKLERENFARVIHGTGVNRA